MSKRATWAAAARRRMPASTARLRARAMTALALRDEKVMTLAREGMHLLLDEAAPSADIEATARRHVAYTKWSNEVQWHPELCGPLDVEGLDQLRALQGGVMVSFLHLGPFPRIGPSLAQSGRDVRIIVDPSLCPPQKRPWQAQVYAIGSQGCELFSAAEGSRGIRERLARGAVVVVASDVPGRSTVRFLGRDLVGSSGGPRVAHATGTPVVPCTMRRRADGTPYYRLEPALHPGDFSTPEELLDEMLRQQEEAVLAWPEAYHEPLGKWSLAPSTGSSAGSSTAPSPSVSVSGS
jgi:lauroyl/myristoyl acyltransferase